MIVSTILARLVQTLKWVLIWLDMLVSTNLAKVVEILI